VTDARLLEGRFSFFPAAIQFPPSKIFLVLPEIPMSRGPEEEDTPDAALASAAARLLEKIRAEPIPEHILVLADHLQSLIDARRKASSED
jgi:hypothetical protein